MAKSISHFFAAAYARASKDDAGSSTIENQIELICDYAKSMPEIEIVSERGDNGFSGIDFSRPAFGEMMKDIEAGRINCVIVKDLSRLGRNYIEVGEMIDVIFPRLNVRLIAINDRFDSDKPRSDSDDIIIPFRNLINEQYLRDFSIKIRSNLDVKRKNGDFVAAFAPYGYKRGVADKHRLVIDGHAAAIVRDIFRRKIQGQSPLRIADRLNETNEPSPAEYKKRDTNYVPQFQRRERALWSAIAVGRILRNPAYIGTLIQGKETTPNYKLKKRIAKPEDQWHIAANAHEPIIDKSDYEIANALLLQDTRTAPRGEAVYPLSGMVFCADCGNNMIRTKSNRFNYYVCASSRVKKTERKCASHCVRQDELERIIIDIINAQISFVLDVDISLRYIESLPDRRQDAITLNTQIADRQNEIIACERYRRSLYEDYKDGVISKDDCAEFGKAYAQRVEELRLAVTRLAQEAETQRKSYAQNHGWVERFKRCRTVTELSRGLAVCLIERIDIYMGKRIAIRFRYRDRMEAAETAALVWGKRGT